MVTQSYGNYICQPKIIKNIIKENILQTSSKVGVLQSKTFSHTPDEAMLDGLAKASEA